MSPTPKAKIRSELLVWARGSIGLSLAEAARKAQVDPPRLESWEQGEDVPTVAQLRKVASVYKRPLGVFYLPEPPLDFMPLADFRTLPEAEEGLSPQLHLEIRRAREQRELHLELLEALAEEAPEAQRIGMSPLGDPEVEGGRLRGLTGLDADAQFGWRDRYEALNAWVSAIEDMGYLALQASDVRLDEMRGFSIAEDPLPTLVVNGTDTPNGKIFTLLHELTHLQLSSSGVCDLHDRGDRLTDALEVFCNQVAAAALMPQTSFLTEPQVLEGRDDAFWSDDQLARLSRRYSVSREAVLRRLLTFDRVSEAFYRRKRQEFLEAYQRSREDQRGFAPLHVIRVRDLGRPFVRTVLSAYYQRRITAADLSRFLGVRLKHLSSIEATLAGEV